MTIKDKSYSKGPDLPAVEDHTIGQLLQRAAQQCPERAAIISGHPDSRQRQQISYAELYQTAEQTAHAILSKFKPGDHIAIMAPNIPEWVILEYGSALAGTVLVTVNPSYQPEEIAYVLKQSRCVGIFVLPEYRGNQMLQSVEQVSAQCPQLIEVIRLDHWSEFLALGKNVNTALPEVHCSDVTMIQYTSGTTGFPKGVLLHHRGLTNSASHMVQQLNFRTGSVSLVMVPLFHTSGCVLGVLSSAANLSTMVLVETFEAGLILELIETYQVNTTGGVPTMMIAMLAHPDFASRDLSSLELLSAGGSTVPAELALRIEQNFNVKFINMFGQTESSPLACMASPDDALEDKVNTIGRAMPNTELKVVDTDTGDTVALSQQGELCTRGYHVMHGYYDMPEATAEAIDADGWLHTGDLCSMDERGYLRIEGRLKDMIIRGGENVYPKEIENVLFKHPGISEVAVVGLPDAQMGEIVAAFIRPTQGYTIDDQELVNYLRQHLSAQKTPKHWITVEQFPMTGSGKIQKYELRNQWLAGDFN